MNSSGQSNQFNVERELKIAERHAAALERIAAALEKIAKTPPYAKSVFEAVFGR